MCSCYDKSNCTDIFVLIKKKKTIEIFSSVLRHIEPPKLPSSLFFNFQVTSAEIQVAAALVDHNIPLAAADTFSPLFKKMFPDSEIAKSFASARTKTTCIVNGEKYHFSGTHL